MVDRERLKLLVDALRSGEYEQGYGQLAVEDHDGVRYCCLGVATQIAIEHTGRRSENVLSIGEVTLPNWVMDWYGFTVKDPLLYHPQGLFHRVRASDANDAAYAFTVIADAFEYTYGQ